MKHRGALVLLAVVAAGLIVGSSLVQGRWTGRWDRPLPGRAQAMLEALGKIPTTLDEWEIQGSTELNGAELPPGAAGYACFSYRHARSGRSVTAYVVCGPSRYVGLHMPNHCYPRCSLRIEAPATRQVIPLPDGVRGEFFTTTFVKEEAAATRRLRMFWACNGEGGWEAPERPEMRFGGYQPIAALYLISDEPLAQAADASPTLDFATHFLPEANRALFPQAPAE